MNERIKISPDSRIYMASWEHMHLAVPYATGLPARLFSRDAWLLILFEEIWCDRAALETERDVALNLKWTNAGLYSKFEDDAIKGFDFGFLAAAAITEYRKSTGALTGAEVAELLPVSRTPSLGCFAGTGGGEWNASDMDESSSLRR